MSLVIVAGKTLLAPVVRRWLAGFPKRNDEAFAKARLEAIEDSTIEVARRTQEQYEDLSRRFANLGALVAAAIEDPAYGRVYVNYTRAVDAEAIDERRRMLEFATAALFDVRLTVAEHSRVERLLRELDPEDVRWLKVIDGSLGSVYRRQSIRSPGHLRWLVWCDSPSADALAASGCVRVHHNAGAASTARGYDETEVTRMGRLVLRVLRLYVRARPTPIEIPGREMLAESRSEEAARTQVPSAVWNAVMSLSASGSAATYRAAPFRTNGQRGPHNGKAVLRLSRVPLAAAVEIAALAPHPEMDLTLVGIPVEGVGVEARPIDGEADIQDVLVHGPHDVLRWLADDVEAQWET